MKYNILNVHIIFQGGERKSEIDFDRILLRITHLYEEGEHPVLSQPTVINLKVHLICFLFDVFIGRTIASPPNSKFIHEFINRKL